MWFSESKIEKLSRKRDIPGLLAVLQQSDFTLRIAAARALSGFPHPEILDALLQAAADPEKIVRYEIVRILGDRSDIRTLPTFIAALGDPEPHVQRQAVEALGKLGKNAVPSLLAALTLEANEVVRQGVILALGEIGADQAVVTALLRTLRDKSQKVRATAAEQLEKIGIFALSFLVEVLEEAEPELRDFVHGIIVGICTIGGDHDLAVEKLTSLLLGAGDRARLEIGGFLSRVGPAAIPPLVRALSSLRLALRSWALRMLDGLHWRPVIEKDKIAWLWAKEEWPQLMRYGSAALEPLLDRLVRGQAPVRKEVAQTLGQLGERCAVEALLVTAQDDHNWVVRQEAIKALGALGDERAIEPLLRLWNEGREQSSQGQEHQTKILKALHAQVTQVLNNMWSVVVEHLGNAPLPVESLRDQRMKFVQRQGLNGVSSRPLLTLSPQRQSQLLVVEDETSTQLLFRRLLERRGYEVSVASDGIEAPWQIRQRSFDLILSDINMPNFDGLQLLQFLKRKGVDTPIIFITSNNEETDELYGLQLGAFDYLKKPIRPELLLERVHRALAFASGKSVVQGEHEEKTVL
jgi:HEAT repeat protein/CheY-like chemotaxis protein